MNSLGIVFPGQGSQSIGMLAALAPQFKEVLQSFAEASDVLGFDLWQLVQEGPQEKLDKTMYTQPAMLAASHAIWRIIEVRRPISPTVLAGHSLGEYTALVCAKSLNYAEAIQLVSARGHYMQAAVAEGAGAMAAIVGLDAATVEHLCDQALVAAPEQILAPANFNSIGQIVIAGDKAAVLRAITLAKEHGAKLAVLLPVSVPSHCGLMKPAAQQLKDLLTTITIKPPQFPVLNNVDVTYYENADSIRDGLARQLYMPVRWVETIQTFMQMGVTQIIECGPGKVLTGLNKRISPALQLVATADLASLHDFLNR